MRSVKVILFSLCFALFLLGGCTEDTNYTQVKIMKLKNGELFEVRNVYEQIELNAPSQFRTLVLAGSNEIRGCRSLPGQLEKIRSVILDRGHCIVVGRGSELELRN